MNSFPSTLRLPVSVKGILFEDGKVWLRKNQREEWELPGGKLDPGEQPQETVVRELREELGFSTRVIDIIDSFLYRIESSLDENAGVLVVSYLCEFIERCGDFEHVGEGGKAEFQLTRLEQLETLNMPMFYKLAILKAWERVSA